MTNREIQGYIDLLNKEKESETIFTRQISETVVVAKVWSEQPKITDDIIGNFDSYRFFFLKNETGRYIGAVLDMNYDLHWYMVPENRKLGYLTKALKESILPYIFYDGRDKQRINIDKNSIGDKFYQNSKRVAIDAGFKAINEEETEFELLQSEFNWDCENIEELNSGINSERLEILQKRVFYAYKLLYKTSDELSMKFNDDNGLKNATDEVKKFIWKLEELKWNFDVSEN